VLSELRYIREGIPFLGPGEEIRCVWDHIDRLIPYLREKGLHDGVDVRVAYKDLPGEAFATEWKINPLLYEGLRYDLNQLPQAPSGRSPQKVSMDAIGDRTSEPSRNVENKDGGQTD
jgi:hypothetical protein